MIDLLNKFQQLKKAATAEKNLVFGLIAIMENFNISYEELMDLPLPVIQLMWMYLEEKAKEMQKQANKIRAK